MNLIALHQKLLWLGGAYVVFLVSLTLEPIQSGLIFLHWVRWPSNVNYNRPEAQGYAPGKVSNFRIAAPDHVELGAWHVLPNLIYEAHRNSSSNDALPQSVFDIALRQRPTILYFHGNAGNRANRNRVRVGRLMSMLNYNFVIIDYRGFGDSSREDRPSEKGLLIDARAAWDYLTIDKGVQASDIGIMGQSLGTGVSSGLVSSLAKEGIIPRAMILIAPFSSVPSLVETYRIGSIIPLLAPFRTLPSVIKAFLKVVYTQFDTLSIINTIKDCPILIVHALNDQTIPHTHSAKIFARLLQPLLPASMYLDDKKDVQSLMAMTKEQRQEAFDDMKVQEERTAEIVRHVSWGGWGVVKRFEKEQQEIIFAEALVGGHNEIGSTESTVLLIQEVMKS